MCVVQRNILKADTLKADILKAVFEMLSNQFYCIAKLIPLRNVNCEATKGCLIEFPVFD